MKEQRYGTAWALGMKHGHHRFLCNRKRADGRNLFLKFKGKKMRGSGSLQFFNGIGGFDDTGREYLIRLENDG